MWGSATWSVLPVNVSLLALAGSTGNIVLSSSDLVVVHVLCESTLKQPTLYTQVAILAIEPETTTPSNSSICRLRRARTRREAWFGPRQTSSSRRYRRCRKLRQRSVEEEGTVELERVQL